MVQTKQFNEMIKIVKTTTTNFLTQVEFIVIRVAVVTSWVARLKSVRGSASGFAVQRVALRVGAMVAGESLLRPISGTGNNRTNTIEAPRNRLS
jgi:hypothetical protein